jgi:hypothetical protein
VLKSLADAFHLSTETFLEQAGLLDDEEHDTADVEAAVRNDPNLTQAQKDALLAVYRGFSTGAGDG